jgi:hypothetical protein
VAGSPNQSVLVGASSELITKRCCAAREFAMRKLIVSLVIAPALLIAVAQTAHADSKEIPLAKLPKLVTKILDAKYPSAELVKAFKEVEEDETFFSVVLKFKKFEYEVTITAEGEILETARFLTAKDLPEAVTKGLQEKHRNAKVKDAVEVREPGQKVARTFHVEIATANDVALQIILDARGKILNESLKQDKK